MRKPVSKNSLRRAMERAVADGQVTCEVPLNTVIDRIWHDMVRENYNGGRKRASRATIRTATPAEPAGPVEAIDPLGDGAAVDLPDAADAGVAEP